MRSLEHQNQTTKTTMKKEKGILMDQLMQRASLALNEGFYLETILICSIILEERIYSINAKFDSKLPKKKEDSRKTLGVLLKDFKKHRVTDIVLKAQVSDELLNEMDWVKEFRNSITHALLNEGLIKVNKDLERVAKLAYDTTNAFRAGIRRWKKKVN